nr:YbgC/FadM family acyl-CoA thioesterase [Sphingomonas bacterium]
MVSPDVPSSGFLRAGEHYLPIRIYYEDTDAGGVVYHANYLRYFERARWEMLALCGADHLAALHGGEGSYVVVEATLRYEKPARLGDRVTIVSRLIEVRASSCVVQQKVMRGDALLVAGRIRVAFVAPGGKPRRQPAAWIAAFRNVMGRAEMGAASTE